MILKSSSESSQKAISCVAETGTKRQRTQMGRSFWVLAALRTSTFSLAAGRFVTL
jgi:hypothetical protein